MNGPWWRRQHSACVRNMIMLFAIITMALSSKSTTEALTTSSSASSSPSPRRLKTEQNYKIDGARVSITKKTSFGNPPLLIKGYKNRLLQRDDVIIEELLKQQQQHSVDRSVPVKFIADTKLPTDIGEFKLRAYRVHQNDKSKNNNNHDSKFHGDEPCVIYAADKPPFGKIGKLKENVPVRIHDQCVTSEVFRSQRCDCKEQLVMSLEYVQKHGGAIIYLQQEGRGIGLANKVAAYELQDLGMDTVDANLHLGFPEDNRSYGVVPSMLREMNINSIQLLTNNPRKVEQLESLGVEVKNTLPVLVPKANEYNQKYLQTKVERMDHSNLAKVLLTKKKINSKN